MRPERTPITGQFIRLLIVVASFFFFMLPVSSNAQEIQLYKSYAGNLEFKLSGNSLRNASNECQALTQSSSAVSIPSGSSLKAAYLYWSGSGQPDTSVTLNGSQVNADVTYNLTIDNRAYFSSRADVTSRVSANSSTYTVSGLTFDTSQPYCDVASVYGGWALLTIYENPSEPLRVINIFDGFRDYYGSSITLTPNNFVVSSNPSLTQGQHAHITWEGDAGNSESRNNVSEALRFNGSNLTDSNNPAGNQFNSYSNAIGSGSSGVDLDTYPIGAYLQAGQRSVSTVYSSGQDRVFLTAEIISIPNEEVSDLSVDISTYETTVSRGSDITYSVSVTNQGPSNEPAGTVVKIPLGTETSFVSAAGTNWNCNADATEVTCSYSASLGKNTTTTPISLLLSTTGSSQATTTTTANTTGVNFDNNLSDNTDSVVINIQDANFTSSIKSVVDRNGGLLYPGDTLRYTIDLSNTSNFNANNVTLTDNLPQYISSFEVIRQPSGSTNNSQLAPAGTNGAGLVVINNMTIAANGTEELVIDAVVSASAPQGAPLTNTAIIQSGASTYNITSPSISVAAQSLANGEIVLRESLAGNLNYELLGGYFRQGANGCSQPLANSSDSITLPTGSTVKAAYLYWSGSGNADNTATLNGSNVTAGYTYEQSYQIPTNTGGTVNSIYYSSRANVTNLINSSGTGTYTVSGVNFNRTQNPYCDYSTAYGGWAMLIVFENANQPLRVVNLYDGFKSFRGESITLNPDNFIISQNAAALGAKHAHITWEGDAGNSENFNNQSEALVFEGNNLTDTNNPNNNQFNSYSNTIGNTPGVDIDDFNIGQYLNPGDTQVTTTYSSGQDLVFLTAEVISIPNEPVSDMTLRTTAPARVSRGANIGYNFIAANNGPLVAPAGTTITLPLNDGATFEGFSGTNWNCVASTTQVVCTYASPIPVGADSPALNVIYGTSNTTQGTISGDAVLDGINFDNNPADNVDDLTVILQDANLSASTKSVLDLNGGQVLPGDTLRYTLTITNSSNFNATNINLTDHMPALISSYTVFQRPASSTDNSQVAPAGDNNTGVVLINDLSITAGSSISVIIDAVISAGAQDGESITNTAVIGNPAINYTISSPPVTINNALDNSGNKPLYLQTDSTLTRIADTTGGFQVINDLQSVTWGLSPALQTDVSLDYSQPIPVTLRLQNNLTAGQGNNNEYQHNVTISLRANRSGNVTTIAAATQQVALLTAANTTAPDSVRTYQFDLAINNALPLLAGDVLQLVISQSRIGGSAVDFPQYRNVRVYSSNNGVTSLAALTSNTVINVENVTIYDDSYPNGNQLTSLNPGQAYYVRADITDPFGAYDVTNTRITINGPSGETPANLAAMSAVNTTTSTVTVEYPYSTEPDALSGEWNFKVRADEGYEGTVFNERTVTIPLLQPAQLTLEKSMAVSSDPINGTNNPKAIPGALIKYTLAITNTGEGIADTDSIAIIDKLAAGTDFYVGSDANVSPITLIDGDPVSSLTLNFENLTSTTDDVEFSNDGGLTFSYAPTPDSNGFDPLITDIRISPKGTMPGSDTDGSPAFSIIYQVKVH